MEEVNILFKREFQESINKFFKNKGKRDIFGNLVSIIIAISFVFLLAF